MEAARPSNITEEELQVKLAMQISQAEIDQVSWIILKDFYVD